MTIVAVASLALGIGANAAIYSLFDQLLLRPTPGVRDPGGLVNLGAPGPNPGSQSCSQAGGCDVVFSYPMFRDLEKANSGFVGIAAHRNFGANVGYQNQTLNTDGLFVSGSYFPLLGVQARARPTAHAERRSADRRAFRGRAEHTPFGPASSAAIRTSSATRS